MATYSQPAAKRQKVKERIENVDYFQGVEKVEFNSHASHSECRSFRQYNAGERVHGRTMDEWTKFSASLTHFRDCGRDNLSRPYPPRPWDDGSHTLDNYKRTLKAFFDLLGKLGIRFWTAFDTDLVPLGDNWDENKANWDEMVEYTLELMQRSSVKLVWLAPDLHSHARYSSGAFTSPEASTFIHAATQTKKCLEVAQRLSAECFLLWPLREGHSSVYTDAQRELKLFAKLLKMTAEYKDRLNYRCQLLLMGCEPASACDVTGVQYARDVTGCVCVLRAHGLERQYKVCATTAYQVYMAHSYNMLGGVVISDNWDPHNSKDFALMMKCILDQGAPLPGGVSLWTRAGVGVGAAGRCVLAAEGAARGLRVAAALLADHTYTTLTQQRYASYYTGFGSRLASGDVSLEDCEEYLKKNPTPSEVNSKSEQLNIMFQRHLDACDQI